MKNNIIFFQGGLGNQLFQYAFLINQRINGFAMRGDCSFYRFIKDHNGFELSRFFDIDEHVSKLDFFVFKIIYYFYCRGKEKYFYRFCYKILAYLLQPIVTEENYQEWIANERKNGYFYGYWDNIKWMSNIKYRINEIINFDERALSIRSKEILTWISQNDDTVAIHIRRGDYLKGENIKIYGNICTMKYYKLAITHILSLKPNSKFIVFSNDIDYVKKNLDLPQCKFIDFNKGYDSWQDLYLMSRAHHNIIANSTFSWWGAFLNTNPYKIVICPSKFTNFDNGEIYLQEWLKCESV